MLVAIFFSIFGNTLTANDILLGSDQGSYFQPTNQRVYHLKPRTTCEMLSDWSIYLVLHMTELSKMNAMSHDLISCGYR